MNIRIDPSDSGLLKSVNQTKSGAQVKITTAGGSAGSIRGNGETAEISGKADLVAEAMAQPEVRMHKVEAIKAQIEAGTYEVDAAKVADAVIDSLMKGDKLRFFAVQLGRSRKPRPLRIAGMHRSARVARVADCFAEEMWKA